MSRVILAWEMGSHYGHLSRLWPLARGLVARGDRVRMVTREPQLATRWLSPVGIPFVAAPLPPSADTAPGELVSYADILWQQGWADERTLIGLVERWLQIWQDFRPDVAVCDHSPTALLAARVAGTPTILIGTGFEIPPATVPLQPFPGFSGATAEAAERAEGRVIERANRALAHWHAQALTGLMDLFPAASLRLTTVPELDHYGPRAGVRYIGPIGQVPEGEAIAWPSGRSRHILAYLRPNTPNLRLLLQGLHHVDAAVVCHAPGVPPSMLEPIRREGLVISDRPVNLRALWSGADLGLSYAPAGMVTEGLLQGVPQLLAPAHVEAQLTAQRVQELGVGLTLGGSMSVEQMVLLMHRLIDTFDYKARARTLAARYRHLLPERSADALVQEIHVLASHPARSVTRAAP